MWCVNENMETKILNIAAIHRCLLDMQAVHQPDVPQRQSKHEQHEFENTSCASTPPYRLGIVVPQYHKNDPDAQIDSHQVQQRRSEMEQ